MMCITDWNGRGKDMLLDGMFEFHTSLKLLQIYEWFFLLWDLIYMYANIHFIRNYHLAIHSSIIYSVPQDASIRKMDCIKNGWVADFGLICLYIINLNMDPWNQLTNLFQPCVP
jgi:hypothetical protein